MRIICRAARDMASWVLIEPMMLDKSYCVFFDCYGGIFMLKSIVFLGLVTLILGGCAIPERQPDQYQLRLKDQLGPAATTEYLQATSAERAEVVRVFSSFDTALQSPRMLYKSKLAEANGMLMEFRIKHATNMPNTVRLFSDLSQYMGEPHTRQYLHVYVTDIRNVIRSIIN